MATPPVSENPVAAQHYAVQIGLTTALADALNSLSVAGDYQQALAALVREFQQAAISLSVDYYSDIRELAEVPGVFRVPVIDPWAEEQITSYIEAATQEMVAEARLEQEIASGQRLVLDGGIDEVFAAMEADPKRPRWARITRPGACSFCLLLATSGAVYRSEDSANFRAHTKYDGSGGVCRCGVEPSFTEYEPPSHIRSMQALYSEATADLPRGADRANAFRRALYAQRKTSR